MKFSEYLIQKNSPARVAECITPATKKIPKRMQHAIAVAESMRGKPQDEIVAEIAKQVKVSAYIAGNLFEVMTKGVPGITQPLVESFV